MAFEITLRNHKATPIAVEVNEPIAGDWRMLTSTHQHTEDQMPGRRNSCGRRRQWRSVFAVWMSG
jgi:hypothetical protein